MKNLPKRQDVDPETTWDLTTVYATDADWEKAFSAAQAQVPDVASYAGTLGESSEQLRAGLEAILTLYRQFETVYTYASMKSDQDTANSQYAGDRARAQSLAAKIASATAFLEPEILGIPEASLTEWLKQDELKPYAHFIDNITANRAHTLSTSEESLLSAASDALGSPRTTFNVLNNSELQFGYIEDEDGEEVQLSHGSYGQLIQSTDRDVREDAFKTLYLAYDSFKNTFATTLSGEVKSHNFTALAHHYPDARAAALARNHIPEAVFDTLIETVNQHLPLLHRYVALRKKLLNVDDLHMYDMYTPLTGEPELTYTYDSAREEGLKALAPLGEDYLSHVHDIFYKRYIDVYENQGKRSGAYSGGAYDTNPFILLNWQDSVDELYTLVHETGHSVHSWYTRHNQPYVYGDYPIFVAEIASTTNENLLTEYLLQTQTDPAVRAYILNYYLDGFKGTVFRQSQFAEFEHWIHTQDQAGQPLTADAMNAYYADLNARYYGPAVERDPEIALEWARIPHFYMNYYVYQYATGFAAASTLAAGIIAGKPGAVDHYLNYLKSGSSDYPIETMQKAGVDMTKADYLNAAFEIFERRLNELETLIAER